MGYQRTPAHHTASAAFHGGDPVWIRPTNRQLRRLNSDAGAPLGDEFSWAAELPQLLQAATSVASTAYGLREQQMATQRQRAQQQDADNAAKAAVAAQAAQAQAQIAAQNAPADTFPVAGGKQHGSNLTMPLIIGGSIVAGLALILLLRR